MVEKKSSMAQLTLTSQKPLPTYLSLQLFKSRECCFVGKSAQLLVREKLSYTSHTYLLLEREREKN